MLALILEHTLGGEVLWIEGALPFFVRKASRAHAETHLLPRHCALPQRAVKEVSSNMRACSRLATRHGREHCRGMISRRQLIQAFGVAAVGAPFARALGQGRCRLKLGDPGCDTTAIAPIFAATGWKTVLLDHFSMQVVDYEKEAAFFNALMGWKIRSDDGTSAVLDIGDFGSIIIRGGYQPPPPPAPAPGDSAGGGRGGRGGARAPVNALMESFCFGIEPWKPKEIAAERAKRGISAVAD